MVCVFLGSVAALVLRYPAEQMERPVTFGLVLLCAGLSLLVALWMISTPWPPGRLKFRSFLFVSLVYVGILLSAVAQKTAGQPAPGSEALQLAITALSFQGAVLILTGRLVAEHGLNPRGAFGFGVNLPRALAYGLMAAYSIFPLTVGLQMGSTKLMELLGLDPQVQLAVDILTLTQSWSDRLILGVVALVLAPVAEELLFRGILYPALKGMGYPRLAFWSTAAVFSLIHFNMATFLALFAFACLLNLLYEWTGNLLTCMVAHATFNAINLVMLMVMQHYFADPLGL